MMGFKYQTGLIIFLYMLVNPLPVSYLSHLKYPVIISSKALLVICILIL